MGGERAERRLVTILVVDVFGYSRLMHANEEATLARLKALRRTLIDPKIKEHRGRIVKTTGDGTLVEFASPVESVRCAVEVQRCMSEHNAGMPPEDRIEFRVGINLGDVIGDGKDIYGDGVNIAARLEALSEPGGLDISREVHDQVRDKLPLTFEDLGAIPVKNIARAIQVFRLRANTIAALPATPLPTMPPWSQRPAVLFAGLASVALIAGAAWWLRPPARGHGAPPPPIAEQVAAAASHAPKSLLSPAVPRPPPPRLSIVVLPFANLSNDPAQEYFADGITDDLTTDLSKIPGSFVIARHTAFTYKGKATDVTQIGRDLNVRYVLEGSVRRNKDQGSTDQVGVNVQLIDAQSGAHLWADRFESASSELDRMQDEITTRLARSLDVQLTEAESLRAQRERPNNPDALDLTMRGWAALNRPRTRGNLAEALELFEQALQLDPHLTQALVGEARSLTHQAFFRWSVSPTSDLARAEAVIEQVLGADPNNAMAHFIKGDIFKTQKHFDAAIAEFDTAIANDRNLALAYEAIGHTKLLSGRTPEAFAPIETAMRLSPRDPALSYWMFHMCHAHTHLGENEDAVPWCLKSIAASPIWLTYVDLAADYAWMGRDEEAHAAVAELLKLMPGYTVQKWAHADFSDNPVFLREYQHIVEGLRKAGLPEQ